MKQNLLENIKIVAISLICSLGVGVAFAWTAPTQSAPNGNVATPLNTSTSTQIKAGSLWLNSMALTGGMDIGGDLRVQGEIIQKKPYVLPFFYSESLAAANSYSLTIAKTIVPKDSNHVLNLTSLSLTPDGNVAQARVVITYEVGAPLTVDVTPTKPLSLSYAVGGYSGPIQKIEVSIKGTDVTVSSNWSSYTQLAGSAVLIANGYETEKTKSSVTPFFYTESLAAANSYSLTIAKTIVPKDSNNVLNLTSLSLTPDGNVAQARVVITYAVGAPLTVDVTPTKPLSLSYAVGGYSGPIKKIEVSIKGTDVTVSSNWSSYTQLAGSAALVANGYETQP